MFKKALFFHASSKNLHKSTDTFYFATSHFLVTKQELVGIKTGNWLIFETNDAKLWEITLHKNYKFYSHDLELCCRPNKFFFLNNLVTHTKKIKRKKT